MSSDKVVISSFGMVGPLGSDIDTAVDEVRRRQTGIGLNDSFTGEALHLAAVRDFNATDYLPKNKARRMDPVNCFAIAAGKNALEAAGLDEAQRRECGVIVGTGFSGFRSVVNHQTRFLRDGIEQLTPINFPTTVFNATAGLAAIELGLEGANTTITGLDVSGEYALLYAHLLVKTGKYSRVLVVGADELSDHLIRGFTSLGFISTAADRLSRPYATDRDGMVLGEGAAALLVELESTARERGADILAEISAIGNYTSSDTVFGYSETPDSIVKSVRQALAKSNRSADDVAWVSSTANAGRKLDTVEIQAITQLFNPAKTAVSALKDYIGDYASSGLMRIGLAISCLRAGFVPGTRNGVAFEDGIDAYLAGAGSTANPDHVLHISNGIGGNSVAMMLDKPGHA